jgi:hypothetical protein
VYPAKIRKGVGEAEMLLKMSKKTEIGRRIKNNNRFISSLHMMESFRNGAAKGLARALKCDGYAWSVENPES